MVRLLIAVMSGVIMLVATISFRAQPHKSAELLSAVAEAVSRMRRTAGCGWLPTLA
jgi:quinol monooxygenase YgiN